MGELFKFNSITFSSFCINCLEISFSTEVVQKQEESDDKLWLSSSLCKVPQIMELVPVPVHWLEKELVPVPVPILLEGTSSFFSSFFSSIFIGRKMQKIRNFVTEWVSQ